MKPKRGRKADYPEPARFQFPRVRRPRHAPRPRELYLLPVSRRIVRWGRRRRNRTAAGVFQRRCSERSPGSHETRRDRVDHALNCGIRLVVGESVGLDLFGDGVFDRLGMRAVKSIFFMNYCSPLVVWG